MVVEPSYMNWRDNNMLSKFEDISIGTDNLENPSWAPQYKS